jgi:uncharacterized membrane protein
MAGLDPDEPGHDGGLRAHRSCRRKTQVFDNFLLKKEIANIIFGCRFIWKSARPVTSGSGADAAFHN